MTDCSDPQCGVCRRVIQDAEREGVWVCSTCFDVPETIDGYVDRLKYALRGPITTRRRVSEEVRLHLEELAAQESETRDRADAERRATQRMGSPERLAAEMPHRRWNPWIVIAATILCGVAGFAYSTHQPKLYASTSSVLYNPRRGQRARPGAWPAIGEQLLAVRPVHRGRHAGPREPASEHSGADANATRRARPSIAAIPTGNGLSFTVTNPSSLDAVRLANAYTIQFPIYLAKNTPDPDLIQMQQGLAAVKLKLASATSDDASSHDRQVGCFAGGFRSCDHRAQPDRDRQSFADHVHRRAHSVGADADPTQADPHDGHRRPHRLRDRDRAGIHPLSLRHTPHRRTARGGRLSARALPSQRRADTQIAHPRGAS